MELLKLIEMSKAVKCALYKSGVNIDAPENVNFINKLIQVIAVNEGDVSYLSHYQFEVLRSLKKSLPNTKKYILDYDESKFHPKFKHYFEVYYGHDEIKECMIEIEKEKVNYATAISKILFKKFDFDTHNSNVRYATKLMSYVDFFENLFYKFEKIAKFKAKEYKIDIPVEAFEEDNYDCLKNIANISFEVKFAVVEVTIKIKPNVLMVINCATKISKHIKPVSRHLKNISQKLV